MACLRNSPVSRTRGNTQFGAAFHFNTEGVEGTAGIGRRLEGEDVLAVDFFADQLDGLFQSALLQKVERAAAGDFGEQRGDIRLLKPCQFFECVNAAAGAGIEGNGIVVGTRAERAFAELDALRFWLQVFGGFRFHG